MAGVAELRMPKYEIWTPGIVQNSEKGGGGGGGESNFVSNSPFPARLITPCLCRPAPLSLQNIAQGRIFPFSPTHCPLFFPFGSKELIQLCSITNLPRGREKKVRRKGWEAGRGESKRGYGKWGIFPTPYPCPQSHVIARQKEVFSIISTVREKIEDRLHWDSPCAKLTSTKEN